VVNRASVLFRPSYGVILVCLTVDPDKAVLEEGFTRDTRGIGHLGTGPRRQPTSRGPLIPWTF
jgi:hypothetical protein